MRQRYSHYLTPIFLVGTFALLSARLLMLVDQASVNILFWDQWDFLAPLFEGKDAWVLFNWQHGLHRMGAGYFLIQALAEWTDWNTRANSFAILGLVMLAAAAALILKKRLFGSLSPWDALILVTVLTATQYEIFIGTPDESAGAFPLLLLIVLCIACTIDRPAIKLPFILIVNFLTIYTGYGFLAAPITVTVFGLQLWQDFQSHSRSRAVFSGLGLLGSIGSILIFMNGYVFYPGAGCSSYRLSDLLRYPFVAGGSFARFVGLDITENRWPTLILGILLATICGGVFLFQGIQLILRRDSGQKIHLVIVFLTGYSLLFSFSAAFGRFCMGGLASGQASRYMTLIIPAFLGLYFFLLTLPKPRLRYLALGVLAVGVLFAQRPYGENDQTIIRFYSFDKENWKMCYLQYEDIDQCNHLANYQIYHTNNDRLQSQLAYLKKNHLNLYLDDDPRNNGVKPQQ